MVEVKDQLNFQPCSSSASHPCIVSSPGGPLKNVSTYSKKHHLKSNDMQENLHTSQQDTKLPSLGSCGPFWILSHQSYGSHNSEEQAITGQVIQFLPILDVYTLLPQHQVLPLHLLLFQKMSRTCVRPLCKAPTTCRQSHHSLPLLPLYLLHTNHCRCLCLTLW